jgi:hypothetical protein
MLGTGSNLGLFDWYALSSLGIILPSKHTCFLISMYVPK